MSGFDHSGKVKIPPLQLQQFESLDADADKRAVDAGDDIPGVRRIFAHRGGKTRMNLDFIHQF